MRLAAKVGRARRHLGVKKYHDWGGENRLKKKKNLEKGHVKRSIRGGPQTPGQTEQEV